LPPVVRHQPAPRGSEARRSRSLVVKQGESASAAAGAPVAMVAAQMNGRPQRATAGERRLAI